jgi:hypothetical protein
MTVEGAECGIEQERREILQQLEDWLKTPMLVLAFAWVSRDNLLIASFGSSFPQIKCFVKDSFACIKNSVFCSKY